MGETGFGVEGTQIPGVTLERQGDSKNNTGRKSSVCVYNKLRKGELEAGLEKPRDVGDSQSPTTHAGPSPERGARVLPSLLETPLLFVLGGVAVSRQYLRWDFSKDHPEAAVFQVPFPGGQAARLGWGKEEPLSVNLDPFTV